MARRTHARTLKESRRAPRSRQMPALGRPDEYAPIVRSTAATGAAALLEAAVDVAEAHGHLIAVTETTMLPQRVKKVALEMARGSLDKAQRWYDAVRAAVSVNARGARLVNAPVRPLGEFARR